MKAQQQEAERRWEEMQSYLRKRTAEHEAAQQGAFRASSLLLNMTPPFFISGIKLVSLKFFLCCWEHGISDTVLALFKARHLIFAGFPFTYYSLPVSPLKRRERGLQNSIILVCRNAFWENRTTIGYIP